MLTPASGHGAGTASTACQVGAHAGTLGLGVIPVAWAPPCRAATRGVKHAPPFDALAAVWHPLGRRAG